MPFPFDPFAVAASLAHEAAEAAGHPAAGWFWLDGEAGGSDGADDADRATGADHGVDGGRRAEARVSYLGAASEVRIAEPGAEAAFLAGLAGAAAEAPDEAPPGASSGGFRRGWVLALGYEFGVALLGPDPAPDDAPPALALRASVVLRLDHGARTAELRGQAELFDAWLARHGAALEARAAPSADSTHQNVGDPGYLGAKSAVPSELSGISESRAGCGPRWRLNDLEYLAAVERCREAIRDGDAYVLCLTDTAEAHGRFEPLRVYARLRAAGSAQRGGVIVTGDRALVSASPERFLSVEGRTIRTRPIKGTRPRGADPAQDAALARELAGDEKERAENLMIVDLMRNDLSRVCAPGSVRVEQFLAVEAHPHVHQLVSTVRGELEAEADVYDAITACFPGGSMTGAPKRSAVEILGALEAGPRGLYSGCFGWIDESGDAELAMTIRGVELRDPLPRAGEARFASARVGSGGGVTVDSDPARELAEKALKAGPLLGALG